MNHFQWNVNDNCKNLQDTYNASIFWPITDIFHAVSLEPGRNQPVTTSVGLLSIRFWHILYLCSFIFYWDQSTSIQLYINISSLRLWSIMCKPAHISLTRCRGSIPYHNWFRRKYPIFKVMCILWISDDLLAYTLWIISNEIWLKTAEIYMILTICMYSGQ